LGNFFKFYFYEGYVLSIIVVNIVLAIVDPQSFVSPNPSTGTKIVWIVFSIIELLFFVFIFIGGKAARILDA
jgi:hypothetical protein